ncbi:hypothetical protein [Nocardia huaxiensis]|uniref:Uncharacterized protein n=1 Tax=Nocardia huaxiensis TaxID=2755382 RepID=A0A7D6ZIG7_9NOCA|nr:hypothetical protein [Nocardia huaxiensis]QLY31759.1 hypothetical protein H0264_05445 [Nocardia huaxiensis]UFS95320.1 hypothetical protein LPY97_32300 [Nocardia huaxiensis]
MFVRALRFSAAPLGALVLAAVALGVTLHRGWIATEFWILTLPLLLAVFVMLSGGFALVLWLAFRGGRRWPLVATAIFVLIGAGGPVLLFSNSKANAWTRFWVERPAFAAVEAMELPPDREIDYYGVQLPRHLCFVSANCKVAVIGTSGGQPVRFVPDYIGIPDDALGYGHFVGTPEPGPYDGFGEPVCPTMELADGWWWLDFC